jgi:hypothetical protein
MVLYYMMVNGKIIANGETYDGKWKYNKREGMGKLTDKNGTILYHNKWIDDSKLSYIGMEY